ncbi:MAG TPA: GGDEF domain-containing protein [Candidatus Limnocylindrales bacterium]
MIDPPSPPAAPPEAPDRRIRRSWGLFAGSFLLLGAILAVRMATSHSGILDWVIVGLLIVAGSAAILHREAVSALEAARRAETESFTRILSGLSRSISPDAILSAIVDELARATEADHIVVVRRRPDARVLDATLTSARPGVPDSSTLLPIADLEDPVFEIGPIVEREQARVPVMAELAQPVAAGADARGRLDSLIGRGGRARADLAGRLGGGPTRVGGASRPAGSSNAAREGQLVADRIAARVRRVYGLHRTLAAPLSTPDGVVGAIVLSHRTGDTWSGTTRRLLVGAADEASAALARAYSHRDAEARASTDALTGLPNRRYFDEFCGLLARRRRSGDAVGVLMIDIDHFKVLNDTYGHAIGDEVLRDVGGAIVAAVREDDVPARYGGEEFVVLLRNPGPDVAFDVGERVRSAVSVLDLGRFGVEKVSVSVGVAVSSRADQPIEDLIILADRALYRAKKAGRDRVIAA